MNPKNEALKKQKQAIAKNISVCGVKGCNESGSGRFHKSGAEVCRKHAAQGDDQIMK
jgi:hypothetical protein